MAFKTALAEKANGYLLMGLRQTRASLKMAIAGRDKLLPPMREVRNFEIPGPQSALPSRLYRPQSAPEHGGPALVYFHGGGFVIGDLDTHDDHGRLLCRDVNVSYGENQVRFGVDFEANEGEIIAILRTNGAGKSTLLRVIAGIQEASDGAIVLHVLEELYQHLGHMELAADAFAVRG